MVFTTHLFIFYYLSFFLIIYYLLPFRAHRADRAGQLSFLRLGKPDLGVAHVLELGSSLRLRPGALPALGTPVERRSAADPAQGPSAQRHADSDAGRVDPVQYGPAGLLQVYGLRGGKPECPVAAPGTGQRPGSLVPDRLTGRHLVLHVQIDELRDRRLPRRCASDDELHRLLLLRGVLPGPGGRAHRPLRSDRTADASAEPHGRKVRAGSSSSPSAWPRSS